MTINPAVRIQIRALTDAIGKLNHLQGTLDRTEHALERAVNLETIVYLNDRIYDLLVEKKDKMIVTLD